MPPNLFTARLADAWPPGEWRHCHVVVAVSGGADSVALLRSLAQLAEDHPGPGRLLAAHFNHCTRGREADEDQQWVASLCQELGVAAAVGHASNQRPPTSEEQARDARYDFLLRTAQAHGARYIATAHTADDQVETVLMRVLRGAGVDGLRGIPALRPLSSTITVVRPMLGIRRSEVNDYLGQLGQPHRTDSSNRQPRFTRNWVRGTLLPLIRKEHPGDVEAALLRLADQATEWNEAIDQLTEHLVTRGAAHHDAPSVQRIVLDRRVLAQSAPIVLQQVCRRGWRAAGWPEQAMGMAEWQHLAAAVASVPTEPFTLPGGVDVRGDELQVVLSRPVRPC